jgi:hypothetical protein
MGRSSCVAVILLLGLGIFPATLSAQQPGGSSSGSRGAPVSRLGHNYPNPFNPTTTIPFTLEPEDLVGGRARVTIRIFNVLQQLVAVPVAQDYPGGGTAPPVDNLEYTQPGQYTAYWDGRDGSQHPVASGLYYIQLLINGRSYLQKALVGK